MPEVLLSGNHQAIETWRKESALIRTLLKRPDLLKGRTLEDEDKKMIEKWCREIEQIFST